MLGAALVVTIAATPGGGLVDFDVGRVAQSMMLAGWAQGIASCPTASPTPRRCAGPSASSTRSGR